MSFIKKLSKFLNKNKSVADDEQLIEQPARDLAEKQPDDLLVTEENKDVKHDSDDSNNKDSP